MAAKLCTDCGTRRIDRSVIGPELCTVCLEYADWENVHQDGEDGEDGTHGNCPICHPELDKRYAKKATGHTNTVAKTHTSHADCNHLRTPAARANCRKTRMWNGTHWV